MRQNFIENNVEKNKDNVIKARASLDAMEYISIIKKESPEDLIERGPSGEIVLNYEVVTAVLNKNRSTSDLDAEEIEKYFADLSIEIENIISKAS